MVPGAAGGAVSNRDVSKEILPESAARRRDVVSDIFGVVRIERRGSLADMCWRREEAADCMKDASSCGLPSPPPPLPLTDADFPLLSKALRLRAVMGRREGISARALGGAESSWFGGGSFLSSSSSTLLLLLLLLLSPSFIAVGAGAANVLASFKGFTLLGLGLEGAGMTLDDGSMDSGTMNRFQILTRQVR